MPMGSGFMSMCQEMDGSGSATNMATYAYNSSNLVQQINYGNGNWIFNVYDSHNRLATNYSAYGNSGPLPPGSAGVNTSTYPCKVTTYDYQDIYVTGDTTNQSLIARLEIVSIPTLAGILHEVSRIYRAVPVPDEVDEYHCPTPGGSWNDPTNLVTRTVRYVNPADLNTYGQIQWQMFPDGTATINNYYENTNGVLTNFVTQTGQPDNLTSPVTISNGVQTATSYNSLGKQTSMTTQYITNGVVSTVLSQQTFTYTDALGLSYYVVDLAGRTNQFQYACCGLASTTDPDDVGTLYTYDTLQRQVAATTWRGAQSMTLTNILDGAGQLLATKRIGTDGSTITLSQSQYDMLGRVISQTNALGGVTTTAYSYTNSQVLVSTTNPDGGTSVSLYYLDGRLQSLTGTAVRPVQYQYGAEQDGSGAWREFTLITKLTSGGGTNEWTKTYTDGAGQLYKTIYPSSSTPVSAFSYYRFIRKVCT